MGTPFLRWLVGGVGVIVFLASCQPTVDCTRIEYLPGPSVVQNGPPPGEPPEMPPVEFQQTCNPRTPRLQVGRWCYDQARQLGGATLTTGGEAFGPVPVASITSVDGIGVTCEEDHLSPLACWGPEGAPFEARVCTTCQQEETFTLSPTCAPGYFLEEGTCEYPGMPPVPPYCPPGWYMNTTGYCQAVVPLSPECPRNYTYRSDEQCCVAQYMEPVQILGIPARTYPACPEGMEYELASNTCVRIYSLEFADCQIFTDYLGYCSGGGGGEACLPRTCTQGAWDPQACCCISLTGAGCLP
jgi:hypothetical protein